METVLDKVLKKCRRAALARVPIIYIKTDSFELIRRIVDSDELVVRVCGKDVGMLPLEGRPFREMEDRTGKKPANWVTDRAAFGTNYKLWKAPHIITLPIPPSPDPVDFTLIENYVRDYQDPESANHRVLKNCVLLLYSSAVRLPASLQVYTEFIEVGYPGREEIRSLIQDEVKKNGEYLENEKQLGDLCSEFSGFTQYEVTSTMKKILTRDIPESEAPLDDTASVREIIRDHKKQKMQSSSVLELISVEEEEEIGGMDAFVRWIDEIARKQVLENADMLRRRDGIQPPKGVLLCGVPGCGKSLAAKAAAKTFRLPLIKMDIGRLMDKFQGESERNMREALALAEAMSPCVLWIDELEKGFSGAQGGSNDSAAFKRMFGNLLGWMQDNKKPCFIFATANDIGGLPKEFFRSGRFDALYGVYLPTAAECANIFKARVSVADKNTRKTRHSQGLAPLFDASCLSSGSYLKILDNCLVDKDGRPRIVTGADIQKIVNTAQMNLTGREDTGKPISRKEWEEALSAAARTSSVYGDGNENIDSLAICYCRMLRKGLLPTADMVLFRNEDYQVKNLKREEGEQGILVYSDRVEELGAYDRAVYELLFEKINEIAPELERFEKSRMLRG